MDFNEKKFYDTIYIKKIQDHKKYRSDNFLLFKNEVKSYIETHKRTWTWKGGKHDVYVIEFYNPGNKKGAFCFRLTYVFLAHNPYTQSGLDANCYGDDFKSVQLMFKIDSNIVLINKGEKYIREWLSKKYVIKIDSEERKVILNRLETKRLYFNDWSGCGENFIYWYNGREIKSKGTFNRRQANYMFFEGRKKSLKKINVNAHLKPSKAFNDGSPTKEIQ